MRLRLSDIDMPSGSCVTRIDVHVDSPTHTDFQPPVKPRM